MAEQSLWRRAVAAINHEYDRRIRRASLVTEYGAAHHAHDEAPHLDSHPDSEHDEDAAEIVNLPKGAPITRRPPTNSAPGPD